MNRLRSHKDIGKTKRVRSRTHGGDRKARPITNHDGRTRGVWGSNRREDTGIWGGVEGGTRVGDPLGADRRRTFFLSSLEHCCVGSSDCGGCWLSCCPVLNTAAPVVQTAGGCWCIYEPMYRGPCIGSIYPTLLGFGGIHLIILSYSK